MCLYNILSQVLFVFNTSPKYLSMTYIDRGWFVLTY